MDANEIGAILTAIVTALNTLALTYVLIYKGQREGKKLEAEEDKEIVDAAHLNLESAEISTKMLISRIDELKKDLDAEKKARQEDAIYFKRRIKEIDREARDYRLWAARLAKQVIEKGGIPVPFISSLGDSDPLIQTITSEQEQLEKAKSNREEEIKNADSGTKAP